MKYYGQDQKHPIGTTKTSKKFAFLPKRADGVWIWLTWYIQHYEYREMYYLGEEVVDSGIIFDTVREIHVRLYAWYKTYKERLPSAY